MDLLRVKHYFWPLKRVGSFLLVPPPPPPPPPPTPPPSTPHLCCYSSEGGHTHIHTIFVCSYPLFSFTSLEHPFCFLQVLNLAFNLLNVFSWRTWNTRKVCACCHSWWLQSSSKLDMTSVHLLLVGPSFITVR